jgi:3-hydroxyacyl-CoA dehydrogenase/enoyl-CoA hydratase/3-hydroxybutyryl-CoA epimerase
MTDTPAFDCLDYRLAENGVAFIAIDVPGRSVNVLTPELHAAIGEIAAHLAADEDARGAVIYSGKSSFMAGGDLNRIVRYYDMNRSAAEAYEQSRTFTESLRKLETCGKPVAVAVNGPALGGGLELALACHHRVVLDDPAVQLGLPEVTLGLLPGGGGTQRLPRLIGLERAADLILSGRRVDAQEALKLGIVDRVVAADELLGTAEQWVLESEQAQQPWDQRGFRIPGGSGLNDMRIGGLFQRLTARVSADYQHNYPAPIAALRCLFNGTTVRSMDEALRIETREFSALTRDPVARNMIRTLFIHRGKASREEILSADGAQQLKARCQEAYAREGLAMAERGVKTALINNAAFAAGLEPGPLEVSGADPERFSNNGNDADAHAIARRLLSAQALAAAECWEQGLVDPVQADLASVLGWGFPKYTGGVMSYIDTIGLSAFIAQCDELSATTGVQLAPSDWLRARARESDRIYSTTA